MSNYNNPTLITKYRTVGDILSGIDPGCVNKAISKYVFEQIESTIIGNNFLFEAFSVNGEKNIINYFSRKLGMNKEEYNRFGRHDQYPGEIRCFRWMLIMTDEQYAKIGKPIFTGSNLLIFDKELMPREPDKKD